MFSSFLFFYVLSLVFNLLFHLSVCLSVCPSVCPSIQHFSQEWPFSFFWFLPQWQLIEIFKNWLIHFPRKIHFCPNLGKKGPKWSQNRVFWIFWKIFSLVLLGNNLKWKLMLLFIFHLQSHIWQKSGSWIMSQNAVSQSNCRILWNIISQKRSEWLNYFQHADKHQSLLQVDTIILGVCNQACPKYPK